MRIRCSICKILIYEDDQVFLDDINIITHQRCYNMETNLKVGDLGLYRNVMKQQAVLFK